MALSSRPAPAPPICGGPVAVMNCCGIYGVSTAPSMQDSTAWTDVCLHNVAVLALATLDRFSSTTGQVEVTVDGPEAERTQLLPEPAGFHWVCLKVDADRLIDFLLTAVTIASADHIAV